MKLRLERYRPQREPLWRRDGLWTVVVGAVWVVVAWRIAALLMIFLVSSQGLQDARGIWIGLHDSRHRSGASSYEFTDFVAYAQPDGYEIESAKSVDANCCGLYLEAESGVTYAQFVNTIDRILEDDPYDCVCTVIFKGLRDEPSKLDRVASRPIPEEGDIW